MRTYIDFDGLDHLFQRAHDSGRSLLYEYEVYRLVDLIGGETTPDFYLLPKDGRLDSSALMRLEGDKVVVKIVSPTILHKSDVGGVQICDKRESEVLSTIRRMSCEAVERMAANITRDRDGCPEQYKGLETAELEERIADDIAGYLVCQYMEPDSREFGNELLVSLRNSREFGTIISAGLGGRDTELYASRFKKGEAVVSSSVQRADGEAFFREFKKSISYRKLAGLTRGQKRIVTDHQLLECFEALIQIGRHYGPGNPAARFVIEELEINPFAFSNFLMMPLDGLCRFSPARDIRTVRQLESVDHLLHPETIGIIGISEKKLNVGRIVLNNILANGFQKENIVLFHPSAKNIESIKVLPDLSGYRGCLDLLIIAIEGKQLGSLIEMILEKRLSRSVILISGGFGEGGKQQTQEARIQQLIRNSHTSTVDSPVFLGANSLGVLSHPGRYDAMFIPESKLPKKRGAYKRNVAIISQSGAYMITRMSKLAFLDPAYAVSIGNQLDLCIGDFMHYFNSLEDIHTLAFYVEGFNDLDGLHFVEGIEKAVALKKDVIFYKAGRTPEGKDALSGHTSSIAGDYMVCDSCVAQAGAMVAETFNMFEALLNLSAALHSKEIRGARLAALSNAGYEAVGIADNIFGDDYRLELTKLTGTTAARLRQIMDDGGISGLTAVSNPLDLTPMASETVYLQTMESLLADTAVDAVITALVPLTPMLQTLPALDSGKEGDAVAAQFAGQIGELNRRTKKPLVIVVDSGRLYDPLAESFELEGLPVFRSADLAVSALGKYMHSVLRNRSRLL
jgi:acyl-CoA synthetase (NDP forming)